MKIPFLFLFVLFLGACASTTDQELEGGKHQVQCLKFSANCHDRAREICPNGYLVTNRVRPIKNQGGESKFTLNIKCRKVMF